MPATPPSPPNSGVSLEEFTKLKAQLEELTAKDAERERLDRRHTITAGILEAVKPEQRGEFEILLDGLHARGVVNLELKDTKEAVVKAIEKLKATYPDRFGAGQAGPPGTPAGAPAVPSGVPWMSLTPEQQRAVTDEEFKKRFMNHGTSGQSWIG